MVDNLQEVASQSSTSQKRQPPVLVTALFAVKEARNAGYGVFANQDIPAETELLVSPSPSVYVIYRTFRKEVCAWCFAYERGRNWKVKFTIDGTTSNGGGLVFCCEECRQSWYGEYGDIGLEAFNALESFIQRQSRTQAWSNGGQECGKGDAELSKRPSDEEVDKVSFSSYFPINLPLSNFETAASSAFAKTDNMLRFGRLLRDRRLSSAGIVFVTLHTPKLSPTSKPRRKL